MAFDLFGKAGVDIRALGDKDLQAKLKRVEVAMQKRIVSAALRSSAARARKRVMLNLSGKVLRVRTGRTKAAFKSQKVKSFPGARAGLIRWGIALPTREELGIPPRGMPGGDHYYPFALEYGSPRRAAHPFMRPAIDNHKQDEINKISNDIARRLLLTVGGKR